jgi:hypothetical protein
MAVDKILVKFLFPESLISTVKKILFLENI